MKCTFLMHFFVVLYLDFQMEILPGSDTIPEYVMALDTL